MLDSIPIPVQAILWPLVGAALILTIGRLLPNWFRRLVASAAALASFVLLLSLRTGDHGALLLFWEPINFFRMSPSLHPDGLALLVCLALAAGTAACTLGIRGSDPDRPAWHGLILIALSGSLVLAMSTNLLTAVMGSAILDLALIAIALTLQGQAGRVAWRFTVPGALSTLVLLFSGLLLDIQVGHASLLAQEFPLQTLILMAAAGLLRLLIYPVHPRQLNTPENAAILLLPLGAGIYLVSRVQHIDSILADQPWMLAIGGLALLAGAILSWTENVRLSTTDTAEADFSANPGFDWPGLAIHQTGFALMFVILSGASAPWPLLSLVLALAMLAILWDTTTSPRPVLSLGWALWIKERIEHWKEQTMDYLSERIPSSTTWRQRWPVRSGIVILAVVALASLAGAPVTAGAVGRWSLYGDLIEQGLSIALLVTLAADTLLATSLWLALVAMWRSAREQRPALTSVVPIVALALVIIGSGLAPTSLLESMGLEGLAPNDVSVPGLGLIYVLPWLVGAWLARTSSHLRKYAGMAWRTIDLDWLYDIIGWIGQRLASAVGWLGLVGEGEGWWGWALIILALGTMLLAIR